MEVPLQPPADDTAIKRARVFEHEFIPYMHIPVIQEPTVQFGGNKGIDVKLLSDLKV